MGIREVPTCGSGKKGYRSPEAAQRAAQKEADRHLRGLGLPPGTRVADVAWYSYLCDRDGCGKYHRTKNPPRVVPTTPTLELPSVPLACRPALPVAYLEVLEAVATTAIKKQGPGLRYPTRDVVTAYYGITMNMAELLRRRLLKAGLLVFREFEGNGTYRTTRAPISLFD